MPVRYAVISGNWSSLATWNGGITLPTASDDCFANGFNVTIDQNINIRSISTQSSGSATGVAGTFISTNGIQITASAFPGIVAGSGSNALTITGSHTVYISGSVQGGSLGAATGRYGIFIPQTGTVYITGSISAGVAAGGVTGNAGIFCTSGSVFVRGNLRTNGDIGNTGGASIQITYGTASIVGDLFSSTNGLPILMSLGNAQVNVIGNMNILGTGPSLISLQNQAGVLNFTGIARGHNNAAILCAGGTPTVNVTGSLIAGYAAAGISSTVASTINVSGSIVASNGFPGISSTSTTATVHVTGPLISSANGTNAVFSPKIQLLSTSTPTYTLETDTFPREVTFYDAAYTSSLPAQINVRSGSLYGGSNEFSGSMVIPSTSSVRYGVPVDSVTGSAVLTPQDLFDFATQNLTGSNTIGERLKNISTIQTTAATIAAFKGK